MTSLNIVNMLQQIRWIEELAGRSELSPQETSRLHAEVIHLEDDLENLFQQVASMEKQITSMEKEIGDLCHDVVKAEVDWEEKLRHSWIGILMLGLVLFLVYMFAKSLGWISD